MQKVSKLYLGDCLDILPTIETNSIDAVVTDPPYFLINKSGNGFMGNKWDSLYTTRTNNIICKSKEFANFVVTLFTLMHLESNTDEENTVQNSVNTEQCRKKEKTMSSVNVQSAENHSYDNHHTLKVNINSVRGIVLTKVEVLDLLNMLSLKNITAFRSLNENALFVIPTSYITKRLKNTAPENVLKPPTLSICVEKEIPLTLTEEAKINGVIEGITEMRSEKNVMPEMDINVDIAGNTVDKKKYKHIILSHTEKEEVTNYLISLLYALFVMPELNKSPTSSFKDIQNRDLIYRFNKN